MSSRKLIEPMPPDTLERVPEFRKTSSAMNSKRSPDLRCTPLKEALYSSLHRLLQKHPTECNNECIIHSCTLASVVSERRHGLMSPCWSIE